jgi:anthranilate synthase
MGRSRFNDCLIIFLIFFLLTSATSFVVPSSTKRIDGSVYKNKNRNIFSFSRNVEDDDGLGDISLGAPKGRPQNGIYSSPHGVKVTREVTPLKDVASELKSLVDSLDDIKGAVLTSSYEFPGRYARWTVGFSSPPLQIEGKGLNFTITALNSRGEVLLGAIRDHLSLSPALFHLGGSNNQNQRTSVLGHVIPSSGYFSEEERSKQPTLFSLVRSIRDLFFSSEQDQLGLFGSFGYDLTFQFEPVEIKKPREFSQRDLVLYLPDEILVVDNQRNDAWKLKYDFDIGTRSTFTLPRTSSQSVFKFAEPTTSVKSRDLQKGEYASSVIKAKEEFRVGNLFEVVLSQVFRAKLNVKPSIVFQRLCQRNPSPYGFFMNLGSEEYLVGASPEMFVRVEETSKGMRVETCPISGTIERGDTPLEDAQQIKKLLLSSKEESELTMCTDVDRNDKSRICVPGSVKVLGRRQIEMYSRLIHTVDHVEG